MNSRNFLLLLLLLSSSLYSFNGLFLTSYGTKSSGMGGVSIAIGGSTQNLENNPAGIYFMKNQQVELGFALTLAQMNYYDKSYSMDTNQYFTNNVNYFPLSLLPFIGWVKRNESFANGIAFYGQGGGGGELSNVYRLSTEESQEFFYNDIVEENFRFRFLHSKLTYGCAVQMKSIVLGLGFDISIAKNIIERNLNGIIINNNLPVKFKTSGGYDYQSETSVVPSGKIGIIYILNLNWKLGFSFTGPSSFRLDGKMIVDTIHPVYQGKIRTKRTLIWPERVSAGISYQKNQFLWGFDIHYIVWSKYFNQQKFFLEKPAILTPIGIRTNIMIMNLKWQDQTVFATGIEYIFKSFSFKAGINYGKTPINSKGLNPIFGSTTEIHYSAGISFFIDNLIFDVSIEQSPGKLIQGSPSADWSLTRILQNQIFTYQKSTMTRTLFIGLRMNYQEVNDEN